MAETAVAKVAPVVALKKYIEENTSSLAPIMPKVGLTPEALVRTALSQVYKNPTLLECDKVSVMRAIVEAASLGLSFSLGRAYLVPFRNTKRNRMEAQLMPGYLGLADIARRSGEVSSIVAEAVYEGDEFIYEIGLTSDKLHHKPIAEPDDKGLTHVYAIVRFKDGGYQFVVMTRKQVDAIRRRSKSSQSGPWVSDYAAMAKKTVIKQVLKLCPASIELVRALDIDNSAETGEPMMPDFGAPDDVIEVEMAEEIEEEKPTRTATVKDALRGSKKAADTAIHAVDAPSASEVLIADLGAMIEDYGWNPSRVDIEISAALAGKIQSFTKLADAGTVDQIKAVMTHFKAVKDEGRN